MATARGAAAAIRRALTLGSSGRDPSHKKKAMKKKGRKRSRTKLAPAKCVGRRKKIARKDTNSHSSAARSGEKRFSPFLPRLRNSWNRVIATMI